MKGRWRRMAVMVCAFLLVCSGLAVRAQERTGTLTIRVTESGQDLSREGIEFTVVKCASLTGQGWQADSAFASAGADLGSDADWDQAARLMEPVARQLAEDPQAAASAITDETGTARLQGLEEGLYLVFARDPAGFEQVVPALVSIPLFDTLTGSFSYDVITEPKHSPCPVLLVNKTDADSGKNITNRTFEFSSYSDPDCSEKLMTVQGNETDGTASFPLPEGILYIRETKAPEGYVLSDKTVKVELCKDGTVLVNDRKTEGDKETYSFEYENRLKESPSSPSKTKTAAVTESIWTAAGLLLAASAALVILHRRRKSR